MIDQYGRFAPDYQQNQFFRQPLQRQEIIHVNGRGGAEAFQMAPNSNVLLLDDTGPIVWLKTTDGAGFPSLTPYTITPYQPEPQLNGAEILDRLKRLEEKIYGQPNAANSES